jgi:hypothetical protein
MSTFVVRLTGSSGAQLRGTVRHVASGASRPFADTAQLIAFLAEWSAVEGLGAESQDWPPLPRDPGNPEPAPPSPNPGPAAPGIS